MHGNVRTYPSAVNIYFLILKHKYVYNAPENGVCTTLEYWNYSLCTSFYFVILKYRKLWRNLGTDTFFVQYFDHSRSNSLERYEA